MTIEHLAIVITLILLDVKSIDIFGQYGIIGAFPGYLIECQIVATLMIGFLIYVYYLLQHHLEVKQLRAPPWVRKFFIAMSVMTQFSVHLFPILAAVTNLQLYLAFNFVGCFLLLVGQAAVTFYLFMFLFRELLGARETMERANRQRTCSGSETVFTGAVRKAKTIMVINAIILPVFAAAVIYRAHQTVTSSGSASNYFQLRQDPTTPFIWFYFIGLSYGIFIFHIRRSDEEHVHSTSTTSTGKNFFRSSASSTQDSTSSSAEKRHLGN